MYEYILALTASGGCCFGFILGGYCLSDKTRIESLDEDMDEIADQLATSEQYCRYLENMLNNSTAVATESSILNVVDASANVSHIAMIDHIVNVNTPPPSSTAVIPRDALFIFATNNCATSAKVSTSPSDAGISIWLFSPIVTVYGTWSIVKV